MLVCVSQNTQSEKAANYRQIIALITLGPEVFFLREREKSREAARREERGFLSLSGIRVGASQSASRESCDVFSLKVAGHWTIKLDMQNANG